MEFIMNKGTIGLNAGAICNLLLDGGCWSFEELKKATALTEADLWSAIGWLARENKIEIKSASSQLAFSPGMNCYFSTLDACSICHHLPGCRYYKYEFLYSDFLNNVETTALSPSVRAGCKFSKRAIIKYKLTFAITGSSTFCLNEGPAA